MQHSSPSTKQTKSLLVREKASHHHGLLRILIRMDVTLDSRQSGKALPIHARASFRPQARQRRAHQGGINRAPSFHSKLKPIML
jgi:hypothetical protein